MNDLKWYLVTFGWYIDTTSFYIWFSMSICKMVFGVQIVRLTFKSLKQFKLEIFLRVKHYHVHGDTSISTWIARMCAYKSKYMCVCTLVRTHDSVLCFPSVEIPFIFLPSRSLLSSVYLKNRCFTRIEMCGQRKPIFYVSPLSYFC